jgi:hypothetical protein
MTAIREQYLYGLIQFETYSQSTGTWTDRTAALNSLQYSEGGRLTTPGANTVDVGTLNASLKDISSVPVSGDFVRLRRYGTTEYAFTGYVQDVGQRVVFDNTKKLSTPLIVTTLYCVDWVAYLTQWVVSGVGGRNSSFVLASGGSGYSEPDRIRAINYSFDSSNATQIISATADAGSANSVYVADTDLIGTAADHLDLLSRSLGTVWYGSHVLPTDNTTGRDNLIKWQYYNGSLSSSKTFTDLVGSAGQLHYTEIDLESSSQNVANKIALNNKSLVVWNDTDNSSLAGGNEPNFIFVDLSTKQRGIIPETEYVTQDDTSIATYGARQVQFDTNLYTPVYGDISGDTFYAVNQCPNPSVEYNDNGWSPGSNNKTRRRQPLQDPNPFAAYNGTWALRMKHTAASATNSQAIFSGGESDSIPVTVGRYYEVKGQCARGTVSRTDLRARVGISWYDDEEVLISTTTGSNISLTTANTWYEVGHFGLAPSGATRATIVFTTSRPSGNQTRGDIAWVDAVIMTKTNSSNTMGKAYFDGDFSKATNSQYVWSGEVGGSPSWVLTNSLATRADQIAAQYNTTGIRATRIRWNAQEDLTSVSSLTVGKTISLIYNGTTTTYRIIGIDGTVDPDRYMIDYYLVKA